MGIKYWVHLSPRKGEDNMQKFTFIEPNQPEMTEGMVCDPVTGLCGPVQKKESKEEQRHKKEEDRDE